MIVVEFEKGNFSSDIADSEIRAVWRKVKRRDPSEGSFLFGPIFKYSESGEMDLNKFTTPKSLVSGVICLI
jgi:hypothetical protein